jgi:rhodanese-related sulfurtransferase
MSQSPTPTVTVVEAADRLRTETDPAPLLVDVRERHEFGVMRVPGAVLLPLSTFTATFDQLPAGRPLLILCAAGSRSARATDFLLANGYTDAFNIAGGISAWNAAGLGIRTGMPEADEGMLPEG